MVELSKVDLYNLSHVFNLSALFTPFIIQALYYIPMSSSDSHGLEEFGVEVTPFQCVIFGSLFPFGV